MIMIYEAVCEYFGLEAEFGVDSFLPEPEVPLLELSVSGDEVQDLLAAVSRVYDIKEDDRRLKKIADIEPGKRKEYFRRLRKEYPVRREFGNTKVRLAGEGHSLAERVKATGFEIADERD
jgi:erythronate-4-phosphate dehydrogenase